MVRIQTVHDGKVTLSCMLWPGLGVRRVDVYMSAIALSSMPLMLLSRKRLITGLPLIVPVLLLVAGCPCWNSNRPNPGFSQPSQGCRVDMP